jgi:hypothetical protein
MTYRVTCQVMIDIEANDEEQAEELAIDDLMIDDSADVEVLSIKEKECSIE